jgi:hypothetical protein
VHDKPLSNLAGDLLRRRPGASHRPRHRVGPDAFGLDEEKVLGFVDGALDPAQESRLAEEVAEVLPLDWSLSPRARENLSQVTPSRAGPADPVSSQGAGRPWAPDPQSCSRTCAGSRSR